MAPSPHSEADRTVLIDRRFAGFQLGETWFAVGGYTCGAITSGWDSASVVLRRPTPVGVLLVMEMGEERRTLRFEGETLAVAETREPIVAPPPAVSFAEATEAARSAPGLLHRHPAPLCFVCGPRRTEGDGLLIFAGPVESGIFAAPWVPHFSLASDGGRVAPEFLWSALECPGAAVFWEPGTAPLAVQTRATLTGTPAPGDPCVVVAAPLGPTDRGPQTATWLLGPGAELLGSAVADWALVPLNPDRTQRQ